MMRKSYKNIMGYCWSKYSIHNGNNNNRNNNSSDEINDVGDESSPSVGSPGKLFGLFFPQSDGFLRINAD